MDNIMGSKSTASHHWKREPQRRSRIFTPFAALVVLAVTLSTTGSSEIISSRAAGNMPAHAESANQLSTPVSYLGVGSPLAVQRAGDPNMLMQGFWLSINSPGTPKEYGDPFTAKWDYTLPGSCCPIGGAFQPDHDTQGYNYGLYLPDNSTGYLQLYDPAYQARPSRTVTETFDAQHPCANYDDPPSSCSTGNVIDFNRLSQRWCTSADTDAGDYQPGAAAGQCDTQAQNATVIYSLYYPDSTPNYYADDVLADRWIVAASPISGTNDGIHIVHSYTYSQTWTNFNDAPDPGYPLYPVRGNHQWRLNVNVPLDNDHSVQGIAAQNNFAIRLKTNDSTVHVSALNRLPLTMVGNGNIADAYLANVPYFYYDGVVTLSLFDTGDDMGDPTRSSYLQLLAPPDAISSYTHPVTIDIYKHDYRVPPGPDIVISPTDRLLATEDGNPHSDFNDEWADVLSLIESRALYQGGFWVLRNISIHPIHDRITLKFKFCSPYLNAITVDCPGPIQQTNAH